MTYEVIIQPPAKQDIEAAYLFLRHNAPAISEKWLSGLERAIRSWNAFQRDAESLGKALHSAR